MIVGTAGHVDHGKTTLVRLLTGVDTDRLKEEKARGITTDLGFAYMPGPGGSAIGFIDVPGHESFVRTMVAGAAGIDFALLVVAADEGVKPQTREHLEILRLLGIQRGLVVVTKADRADAARRAATLAEIDAARAGSPLAAAPVLFVSATTGEGLDALKASIFEAARASAEASGLGVFRLPVDRAFTLKGLGTIVSGTAVAGRVAIDDMVTIMPGRLRCRVRSLHVQSRAAEAGRAGDRCALALVGVSREAVRRGAWICGEPDPGETTVVDAELQVSASETKPLRAAMPVHLHCGASDVLARIVPLAADIAPGGSGVARITLAAPLPLRNGDRLVLRDASARRTLGGGRVLDTRPPTRRRRTPERLARLAALRLAEPSTAMTALLALPPCIENLSDFAVERGLAGDQLDALVARLDLVVLPVTECRFAMTQPDWSVTVATILAHLAALHAAQPEVAGLSAERLRASVAPLVPPSAFVAVAARLLAENRLAQRGHVLHLPGHEARLGDEDRAIAARLLSLIEADRFRPPRVRDIAATLALDEARVRRTCKALAQVGDVTEIATDHFFTRDTVEAMAMVAHELSAQAEDGWFGAAAFRDRLDNGRKVAIQILDFFDRTGRTHRQGDLRRAAGSHAPEASSSDKEESRLLGRAGGEQDGDIEYTEDAPAPLRPI